MLISTSSPVPNNCVVTDTLDVPAVDASLVKRFERSKGVMRLYDADDNLLLEAEEEVAGLALQGGGKFHRLTAASTDAKAATTSSDVEDGYAQVKEAVLAHTNKPLTLPEVIATIPHHNDIHLKAMLEAITILVQEARNGSISPALLQRSLTRIASRSEIANARRKA